jgi:hypothetical protein
MIAAPLDKPFCFYLVILEGVQVAEPSWFEYHEVELLVTSHNDDLKS